MQTEVQSLLELPVSTIAVLAAGYIGYRIAFQGKDQGHKSIDVLFATMVFALVARMATILAKPLDDLDTPLGDQGSILIGVLAAAGLASIWRKWLANLAFVAFRSTGIGQSDRYQTVIHSIISREHHRPTQIVVRKKDGSAVMCERLSDFEKAPFGPYLLGPDGSIGMYITSYRLDAQSTWVDSPIEDSGWGNPFTVIAADQVGEIEIRFAY